MILEVKNLKKQFGKVTAVNDVSFSVEKGEIFGFLGPNGAGKTTTIRCLMGFIKPTSGEVKLFGENQKEPSLIMNKVGFLSGNVKLYDNWTGADHLAFFGSLAGKNADNLVKRLDFNPKIKVRNLSSGNKQKLGLLLALIKDPELLILDEPTVGLDPLLQNTIHEILIELKQKGTTIFMSSHYLSEVEKLCDRVGIIKDGNMVSEEKISDLFHKRMNKVLVTFNQEFQKNDFVFDGVEITKEIPKGLELSVKGDINPFLKKLSNYKVKDMEVAHATLEEIFLEFYK